MRLARDRVVTVDFGVLLSSDIDKLHDAGKVPVLSVVADATGDSSVFREGVVELEADDRADTLAVLMSFEPTGDGLEGLFAVEVVTIDDGERLVDNILGHQNRMRCSPRFLTLRIESEP